MGETVHLTRRHLLQGAAAAGAASLVAPRAGAAAAAFVRRSVFARSVGTLSGESAPIRGAGIFSLVGIQWATPSEAHVELRAQAPGGRWSPWVPASALGHDGDGQSPTGPRFGEPVWTGPANVVQLRTDRPLTGVRVNFVSAGSSPADAHAAPGGVHNGAHASAGFPLATPILPAGPGQPPIIARRAWGHGRAHPRQPPFYGSVKLGFVHHTVDANGYSAAEVPAMLRAIFAYHVRVRGWWDIGYNFLIDAYGRIWEGRAGGIDMAVVGAQAGAYNTESTGVAMLGNFMNTVPSAAALHALQRLLAWKLSLHGVPTTGRVTVVVDPADAFYTRFRPGQHVSLPRVAGHRDGDLTSCPGNALYHRLPSLRPRIAQLAGAPARATIGPSSPLMTEGASTTLSGTLGLLSGQPLGGAPIELQQLGPAGSPATTFLETTTASDGTWSAAVSFPRNTIVRALHRPAPASVSDWIEVLVAPAITLSAESLSPLIVTGTVAPGKPQVTVDLYPAGVTTGKPISKRNTSAASGTFSAELSVPGPGDYVVIARTKSDTVNAAGVSAPLAVTIS
jgi:hypothetical protein